MTKQEQTELAAKARTSIHFLAWDVDEYVEPDFEDPEQQTAFTTMYDEMFENLDNLLAEFIRITQ